MGTPTLKEGLTLPNARAMASDAPGFLLETARRVGPFFRLGAGPLTLPVIAEPELLQHVFQKNSKAYGRGAAYDIFRPLLGNGLPVSDPPVWLYRRRTMQPAFHRGKGPDWVVTIREATAPFIASLTAGQAVEARPFFMSVTRDIIMAALFSSAGGATSGLQETFTSVDAFVGAFGMSPVRLPLWVPTPTNRRFMAAIRRIDELLLSLIERRRAEASPPADLLTTLIRAKDPETGNALTDVELRDEVVNLFIAGHETTANLLSWSVVALSRWPEVRARAQAEVAEVLEGAPPTAESVEKLDYLHATVREVLRYFPPAWLQAREVFEADTLRDVTLAPKDRVLLVPYITHHRAELWDEPERFDPTRFLKERSIDAATWKYRYLPFGAGPHVCIGNHFAILEAVTVLAMLFQKGHLEAKAPQAERPTMGMALMPSSAVPSTFVRREHVPR
ncbi:MAG: cytochrome P450 [Myxococcaceae bacterium]|nr:cytochrome P450 [Myxococcaceae bacterium]